jgi:hypothetical protein
VQSFLLDFEEPQQRNPDRLSFVEGSFVVADSLKALEYFGFRPQHLFTE